MQISDSKKPQNNPKPTVGHRRLKILITAALMVAVSMTIKRFSITAGPFRFSLENLPLLLSGIILGPILGAVVGIAADLLGCLISGFTVIPLITLGAALIGFVPGLVFKFFPENRRGLRVAVAVGLAHLLGSVIVKSIGLHLAYGNPWQMLCLRIPLYIATGAVEGYIIYLLTKNKAFIRQTEKLK